MNKNVFTEQNYRLFLRKEIQNKQHTLGDCAAALEVSSPYLSRVLSGKGHLNREQIHLFCTFLNLESDLAQILSLYAELEQAQSLKYKKTLTEQLQKLRTKKSELAQQLVADVPNMKISDTRSSIEYHLNPLFQVIHMALEIPHFQTHYRDLAKHLHISSEEFERILEKLTAFDLVKKVGHRILAQETFLHLKEGDFVSEQNHNNWRVYALRKRLKNNDKAYQYTATVSADESAFQWLRDEFKELISRFSKNIRSSKNETVFQVNVDLFHLLDTNN